MLQVGRHNKIWFIPLENDVGYVGGTGPSLDFAEIMISQNKK